MILFAYGIVVGIILWSIASWVNESVKTDGFCLGCHQMREFVLPEMVQSTHYLNTSGVRVQCTGCHTSAGIFSPYILGNNYVYLWGGARTKEEYEKRRFIMAQKVWSEMKENDSQACRVCHDFSFMNHFLQDGISVRQHILAQQQGVTCIDCHKGLVHPLPAEAPPRTLISE